MDQVSTCELPNGKEAHKMLEESFEENPYPTGPEYKLLGAVTGLDVGFIKKWFAATRSELRKDGQKGELLEYRTYRRLESLYQDKKTPSRIEMEEIATNLNISKEQVVTFFAKKYYKRIQMDNESDEIERAINEPDSVIYI